MPLALILAWNMSVLLQSPPPPGEDASVAMHANFSVIKDVQFVFEGRVGLENVEDKPEIRKKAAPDEDYQGTYAYRTEDGATFLDVYHQVKRDDAPLRRTTQSLLSHKLDQIDQTPDLSRKSTPASSRNGGPGSFNTSTSPEPFVPFWTFREILLDPASYHYEALGWEEVDGRRCRKIQVSEFYRYDLPDRRLVVYWIDLERGGLPLKIEYTRNGVVTRRTHEIRPQSFKAADGHLAWVPVSGKTDYFSTELGEVAGRQFVRDTCTLVLTSVRINQDLPDAYFSVRKEPSGPVHESIQKARRQFEASSAAGRAGGLNRTDPRGVREKLAENLAEADRQSKEIEASSVARESSRWPSLSAVTAAVSVLMICLIAVLAWRRRR